MKKAIYVSLVLTIIVTLIAGYLAIARYSDIIYDEHLERGKWGNVSPFKIIITCLFSITILITHLKYYSSINLIVRPKDSIIIGLWASVFFIFLATFLWSGIWSKNPNALAEDARTIGDSIWKLGHPLTFLIIDFPIYLKHRFEGLQRYWSDFWAYPIVLILFIIQFSIYVHGIRFLLNYKKIKSLTI